MSKLTGRTCAAALLLASVWGYGCTNSDPLGPEAVSLVVDTQTVGGDGTFECVLLGISRFGLSPQDPNLAALLPDGKLDLLNAPIEFVDFSGTCTFAPDAGIPGGAVPPGSYVISDLQMRNALLFDKDAGGGGGVGNCQQGPPAAFQLADVYDLVVDVDAQTLIRLTVDIDAMEAQLAAAPGNCQAFYNNIQDILTIEIN